MNRSPVTIMFHSVGLSRWPWRSAVVSEPIAHFESRLAALARAGYSTSFFATEPSRTERNGRSVVLTFDDGYLDNWVHVFPMLERYGLKATIFVTGDFVDRRDVVRPRVAPGTLMDRDHDPGTCCAGFLSWPEMREMEKSGLVDIQSHCMTHTWYYKSPKVVDFWHPGAGTEALGPIWMLWNRFAEFKPEYLTRAAEYESRIPYGTPIYEHGKSLATLRFFPEESLESRVVDYVQQRGGREFFAEPNWRERLFEVVRRHRSESDASPGRYESEAEQMDRIRDELQESKRLLESNLDKQVTAVCWPGGGLTKAVLEMARDMGYRRFTMPSTWQRSEVGGEFTGLVPRISGGSRVFHWDIDLGRVSPREFCWRIEAFRGSQLYRALSRSGMFVRWAFRKSGLVRD